jgi:phage gp16-like protein
MTAARLDKAAKQRHRHLAMIHAAAKELSMQRDVYVALLQRVTGKSSAADLDDRERRKVMDELRRLGAKRSVRPVTDGKPANVPADRVAMVAKVEALLADAKRSWNYAHGLARRMFKVARVEWCKPDQLHKLIAALSIDAKRRAAREADHD